MRIPAIVLSLSLCASALVAQNCPPPSRVATLDPFMNTHYLSAAGQSGTTQQNLPPGYRGVLQLFDLAVDADITVSQIDVSLDDDGADNWGARYGIPLANGLVGQTTTVNVYTCATTWTGNQSTLPGPGSPWTLAGSGTLTVADRVSHSPIVFPTPFTLQPGNYGVAIEIRPVATTIPAIPFPAPYALHPELVVHPFALGVPTTAGDQFLTFSNHGLMKEAFVVLAPSGIKNVVELHYTPAASSAYATQFGSGCYDHSRAFYEAFDPVASPFDLAGRAFQLQPVASWFVATPVATNIVPPPASSPPLANGGTQLQGDDTSDPIPLPFVFPYPGGSATQISVSFNGGVFLDPTNTGLQRAHFEAFGASGFLTGPPQIAALWSDHQIPDPPPPIGGTVHFHTGPAGQPAYITWFDVEEWLSPGPYTFQLVLHPSGAVEFHYDNRCATAANLALVGFTPGWDAHDPGGVDISTAMPFLTGDGAIPPVLTMSARPQLGSTPDLVARDLPAGTSGAFLLGLTSIDPGLNLASIGMPGCLLRVNPLAAVSLQAQAASTSATWTLNVPNNPALFGGHLLGQAVAVSPGSNALGLTVSNGLCIRVGN